MPTTAIILAGAVLTASGCTPDPFGAPPGPPARHVDVEGLPALPLHDAPPRSDLPASPALDPADPAAVAISHIRDGLTAEGLEVVDLGADETAVLDGRVTVQVVASHRTGPAGQPYTSVYELYLARQPDGSWTVTASRAIA